MIFIFDVDDCIIKNYFPNDFPDTKEKRKQMIKTVKEKGENEQCYENFIKFYKKIVKKFDPIIIIVTGRIKKELGELTLKQLSEIRKIKPYYIIYSNYEHEKSLETYFNNKIDTIKLFIDQFEYSKIRVYDDMDNYFDKIIKYASEKNVNLKIKKIKSNKEWGDELREIKKKS